MKARSGDATLSCLRCDTVALRALPGSGEGVSFYECPVCLRHYSQKQGGSLTYRWLNPISLALYGVLFEREPLRYVQRSTQQLLRGRTQDEVSTMVREIEQELGHPTQQVREILDNVASEEACRSFLAELVYSFKAARVQ